jgi:hypothetical protein
VAAPSGDGGVLERARIARFRAGAAIAAAGAVLVLAGVLTRRGAPGAGNDVVPGERIPYLVEVLNGTTADGLARTVTRQLQRAGIDVVFYGTNEERADSTLIIVRGAEPEAGRVVRDALGVGRVVVRPDANLLLDVTVLLGDDAVGVVDRGP